MCLIVIKSTKFCYFSDKLTGRKNRDIKKYITPYLPFLSNESIWGYWTGLMPFSKNGSLILGNLSKLGYSNIWIANGFGPKGIMWGPMATKILAENIIFGKYSNLLVRYDPIKNGVKKS